jgi:hypothetical protein
VPRGAEAGVLGRGEEEMLASAGNPVCGQDGAEVSVGAECSTPTRRSSAPLLWINSAIQSRRSSALYHHGEGIRQARQLLGRAETEVLGRATKGLLRGAA